MKKYKGVAMGLYLSLMCSCVSELEISTSRDVEILVVEGGITSGPGPHYVRVTESDRYGSVFDGFVKDIESARVSIRNDLGDVTHLQETAPGLYATSATFKGEVGTTYTLLIQLKDGRSYVSLPEKMEAVPSIDSLTAEYRENFERDGVGSVIKRVGFEILAHYSDPSELSNYYLWKSKGVFRAETQPEDFVNQFGVRDGKDCCATCWVFEENEADFRIHRDAHTNGSDVIQPVSFVHDDGIRFTEKYLIIISQNSLSKDAYSFFSLLQEQMSIQGDVFDPPPATIRGNLIRTDKPDENVIGFFRVSDVRTDSLFLFRSDLLDPASLAIIPDDCLLLPDSATTVRPTYW